MRDVKVLRIKEYVECTIRLVGCIREDTHSVNWETGAIMPFLTISLRLQLVFSQYSMGTFH